MKYVEIEKTNRRMRLKSGMVFAIPCGKKYAAGIICTSGAIFYIVVMNRLSDSLDGMEGVIRNADYLAGFWTLDALFYHRAWIVVGLISISEMTATSSAHGNNVLLSDIAFEAESLSVIGRKNFSPALFNNLLYEYFVCFPLFYWALDYGRLCLSSR